MKHTLAIVLVLAAAVAVAEQRPPWGAAQGRGGRGSGPRGADPLVLGDHAGFTSIFDGSSLKDWDGDPAFWRAEGGAIVGQSTLANPVKQNTFVIWRGGEPKDFELKVEFKMSATNSGIQVRSVQLTAGPELGHSGM